MVINWKLAGKIKASSYRRRVLQALESREKTPTEISKELNIKISHISRALTELEEMNLIKCLTSELRKGRIYRLTKEGKKIANYLKKQ